MSLLWPMIAALSLPAKNVEPSFERVVVTFDGLGAVVNRYGVMGELVLDPRMTITAMPWLSKGHTTGSPTLVTFYGDPTTNYSIDYQGYGLDFQFRRYFGPWVGARGFFLAGGLDVSSFVVKGVGCTPGSLERTGCDGTLHQTWTYVTPALDLGGQAIVGPGFTLGASAGARYNAVADGHVHESYLPATFKLASGPGFGLRFRLWVGWAF